MRKFSILRYLKQFSLLIFLLSALGALAIAFYGKAQQRYVASAVIRYTNSAAKQGYTPDGSPLNVEEIYSPTVIDAALTDLGDRSGIDSVRSGCYVEEVIPETQLKRNEALLEKGEDPAYTADTYRVYYVGNNDTGEQFARNVLEMIDYEAAEEPFVIGNLLKAQRKVGLDVFTFDLIRTYYLFKNTGALRKVDKAEAIEAIKNLDEGKTRSILAARFKAFKTRLIKQATDGELGARYVASQIEQQLYDFCKQISLFEDFE